MIQGSIKTEKEYRAVPMDSSSSLKEFSLDRRKYYKKYVLNEKVEDEEDNKAATTGKVVETLLFEPDLFDDRFYLSSIAKTPTGNMLALVEALYKHTREATNVDGEITKEFGDLFELAYKDSGFKLKMETVLNKFVGSDAEIYYQEIRNVRGRGLTVVTPDEVTNAEKIVEELKTNIVTAHLFNLVNSDRYTRLVQYQVEGFEVDGLEMKAMMDLITIDHREKTIQVDDLKCVWAVENFYTEYYLYRRAYIQAYIYKQACLELKKRENLEYYTVLDPRFIVCDSINYYNPLIYILSPQDMRDAYIGFTYNGRTYPGVHEIIEDLKWAKENDIWNISRINYKNSGIVRLTK